MIVYSFLIDLVESLVRMKESKKTEKICFQTEEECEDFTILIPVYNATKMMKFLKGVLRTVKHWQEKVLIVDDASTDGTDQIVKNWGFRVVKLENNGKKIGALHEGLKFVNTPYTVLMDSDSFPINPERLSKLINFVKRKGWEACAITVLPLGFRGILAGLQYIEYLLAMEIGRASMEDKVLCVSGAFGVFKTNFLREITREQLERAWWEGEDFERTMRIIAKGGKVGFENFIVFTDVPKTLRDLIKQRILWGHGYVRCHLKFIKMAVRRDRLGLTFLFNIIVNIILHPLKLFSLALLLLCPELFLLFYFAYFVLVSVLFKKRARREDWQRFKKFLPLFPLYSLFLLVIPTTIGYLRFLFKRAP